MPTRTATSPTTPKMKAPMKVESAFRERSSATTRRKARGVAAWLAGIITNLLVQADFYDVALRDFGLLLAALALARLAAAFNRPTRA